SQPAVVNGVVYINGVTRIYALDAGTGHLLWNVAGGGANPTTIAGGVIYANSLNPKNDTIAAYRASDGAILWQKQLPASLIGVLTVADGVIYLTAEDFLTSSEGTLYVLDARTGASLWAFSFPSTGSYTPVVSNGVVYFTGQGPADYIGPAGY